jgi:hypothetical protein
MSESEPRPRVGALGTTHPDHFTSTWIVRRSGPQQLREVDLLTGARPNDEWFDAEVEGRPDLGGRGSCYLGMIHDFMNLLGLVRHDPEPGDPADVIERWSPVE